MSWTIVLAMRVMDLLFSTVRLGVGRPMILAAVFVMREFVLVCDREHGGETCGAVQEDGWTML